MTAPIDGRARDRSVLEEEREFFLRSLRDLESEHAAGDIDPVDYRSLRDDYTMRAADVLRQLAALDAGRRGSAWGAPGPVAGTHRDAPAAADGTPAAAAGTSADAAGSAAVDGGTPAAADGAGVVAAGPAPEGPRVSADAAIGSGAMDPALEEGADGDVEEDRPVRAVPPWRRPIFIIAAIAIIGAGIGWAVAGLSGTNESATTRVANFDASAQVKFDKGLASEAYSDYEGALAIDPADPIALTGEGEVLVIASSGNKGQLLDAGLTKLAQAELADPSYGLAYGWRGVALIDDGDPTSAIPQLQTYLRDTPTVDKVTADVKKALADARKAVAAKKS